MISNKKKYYPKIVPEIIDKMHNSEDVNELIKYENILLATFISSIGEVASVISLIVAYIQHDTLTNTIIIPIMTMITSIVLYFIPRTHWKESVKTHLINIVCIFLAYIMIFTYYKRINTLSWFILFIIILIAVDRVEKNMLYYSIAASMGIYIFASYMNYNANIFTINNQYYNMSQYNIIQLILLFLILIISLALNKLHSDITMNNFAQIRRVTDQKEKISMLYEEVLASEEELKQQNDELIKNNEKMNYMANYDSLTGLPNRKMFMDKLDLMCKIAKRDKLQFAVVFIDLDNFKKINDTMGHYVGDLYLCEVSNRLSKLIHKEDILARLGGDEFALIVHEYSNRKILLKYIESLQKSFGQQFSVGKYELRSSASFGISVFPYDAEDSIELIKAADTALYKVKELGKDGIQFFNSNMRNEIIFNTNMENTLLNALDRGELYLVYQPQFGINDNKLNGFEALLRWKNSNNEEIGPTLFIPIAEKIGVIEEIGQWVLEQACKKINYIKHTYNKDFFISVNVSPVQMKNPNFVEKVKYIIEKERVNPHLVELEITESVFIGNMDQAIFMIKDLKKIGVHIALDDFGTGYSSLNYLRQLPIDTLKIDKSFIDDLDKDDCKKEKTIVNSIISLMHEMKISVVSEGVETYEQLRYLKNTKCDKVQGFLLARPLAENDMSDIMTES